VANNSSDLVVETFKLTKIYQNRQIALNDVTLRLETGCVLGLLGSNGAGKTTLLRLLIGLHRPTAGWAKVFGKFMTPNAADLRRRIGYIPTNPQFPRGMTPITYLDYMARLFGLPKDVRKPRLASLIRAVDLLRVSGDPIAGFSNGMTARRRQSYQRAGSAHLGRADARTRSGSPPQYVGSDQNAVPRQNADRLQPQSQRHR
jgi:ABC-2 type transport system ATP-binding protein